jgi:hypothetical protein
LLIWNFAISKFLIIAAMVAFSGLASDFLKLSSLVSSVSCERQATRPEKARGID